MTTVTISNKAFVEGSLRVQIEITNDGPSSRSYSGDVNISGQDIISSRKNFFQTVGPSDTESFVLNLPTGLEPGIDEARAVITAITHEPDVAQSQQEITITRENSGGGSGISQKNKKILAGGLVAAIAGPTIIEKLKE
jgi:hypothetical protein